jgi:hypothetical protein
MLAIVRPSLSRPRSDTPSARRPSERVTDEWAEAEYEGTDTTAETAPAMESPAARGTGLFDAQIGQSVSGRHPAGGVICARGAAIEGSVAFPRRRYVLVVPGAPSVGH